jgi:hypothetical protein
MIPFFDEFHAGSARLVPIQDIGTGEHAIILSLHFRRALIIRVTGHADHWTNGEIISPADNTYIPDMPFATFSRDHSALALPLTPEEVADLTEKYKHMIGPK